MLRLKDYIFYRMYLAYGKHDDVPRFDTLLFFAYIDAFLSIPFGILICAAFRLDGIAVYLALAAPSVIGFIFNWKRYNKKKIEELLRGFKYSKYNKRIKNWMIYVGYMLVCWAGIFGIIPLFYVISYLIELSR